jgi:hypothetical protein
MLVPTTHLAAFTSLARATRKATILFSSVVGLLVGGTVAVLGQSALDGFFRDVASGFVH